MKGSQKRLLMQPPQREAVTPSVAPLRQARCRRVPRQTGPDSPPDGKANAAAQAPTGAGGSS